MNEPTASSGGHSTPVVRAEVATLQRIDHPNIVRVRAAERWTAHKMLLVEEDLLQGLELMDGLVAAQRAHGMDFHEDCCRQV
jgi:hypothetical protein